MKKKFIILKSIHKKFYKKGKVNTQKHTKQWRVFCFPLLFCGGAFAYNIAIKNANEFIDFVNTVDNNTDYSQITILIDNDLDFTGLSDKFVPSGDGKERFFLGSLDGQGYRISNLKFKSSNRRFIGFIGYSNGMTTKNVVVDSSCSFENSYNLNIDLNWGYVAGVIGCCLSYERPCYVESCVNMASLLYNGNTRDHELYMGGIVAKIESYNHKSIVKNCANYGQIKNTGTAIHINLGGIAGIFAYETRAIKNCVNYGNIIDEGSTMYGIRIGGIVGINAGEPLTLRTA